MYSVYEIAEFVIKTAHDDNREIDNLQLQKFLYYIQGASLALKDEPLFEDEILAWKHGPVVYSIYNKYKEYSDKAITEKPSSTNAIKEFDQLLISEVYKKYSMYTAWQLVQKTHEESPWADAKQNDVISNEDIKEYFKKNVYNEKGFENIPIVEVLPSEWHDQEEDAYWETQYHGKI